MRVIINITNGKNDRMALAATENANVCTSVRMRYFNVDSNNPEDFRRVGMRGEARSGRGGRAWFRAAGLGGLATEEPSYQRKAAEPARNRTPAGRGGYEVIFLSLLKLST